MPAFVEAASLEALALIDPGSQDAEADSDEGGFEHLGGGGGQMVAPPRPITRCGRAMEMELVETTELARSRRCRNMGCHPLAVAAAACLALLAGAALLQSSGSSRMPGSRSAPGPDTVGLEVDNAPDAGTGAGCSLFCFSVMRPNSTEQALVEYQIRRRASIFACEDYAVISTQEMVLGAGNGDVKTWYNPAPKVPLGTLGQPGVTTNSFLNTAVFIQAFDTLVKSGRISGHDFLVKVDPDAVFFPDRARAHLAPLKGQTLFFTNCDRYPEPSLSGPRMFGAVEVFSVSAMAKYKEGAAQCANREWHGWGEDYYMQTCMVMLGVKDYFDFHMVGDSRCNFATCKDASRMAYHPFKDLPSYQTCFKQAIGEIA